MTTPPRYRQLPLPLPRSEHVAAAQAALAAVENAPTAADRRRAAQLLAARLAQLAAERGRTPRPARRRP